MNVAEVKRFFKKLKFGDAILLCWVDAASRSSWQTVKTISDIEDSAKQISTGFFIRTSELGIFLTGCKAFKDNYEDFIGVQYIPIGAITGFKKIA